MSYHAKKHGLGDTEDHASATMSEINALLSDGDFSSTDEVGQDHVVYVAKDGNDTTGDGSMALPYLTVEQALTSITDSSGSNRYTIKLAPGQYTENNPLTMKEGVTVQGVDDIRAVDIIAQNASSNIFDLVASSNLHNLSITGATTATGVSMAVAGSTSCSFLYFTNCQKCVHFNHASIGARFETIYSENSITVTEMIYLQAGAQVSMSNILPLAGTFTNIIRVSNATGTSIINQLITDVDGVGTAYSVENGANSTLMNSRVSGDLGDRIGTAIKVSGTNSHLDVLGLYVQHADYGVYVDGDCAIDLNNVAIETCDYGIYTHTTGNEIVRHHGGAVSESITWDIYLTQSTCKFRASGIAVDEDKLYLDNADVAMSHISSNIGDEGLGIKGELHVGSPEKGAETVLGEGDSYTRGLLAYSYNGSTYTDISDAVKSYSGSTFTFPNLNVDSAIYIGSDLTIAGTSDYHKSYGIKLNLTTAQVGGTIVAEYWSGATGSITAFADATGGQVEVTSTAHGIREGQGVTITGTTNYNGRFTATNVTDDTFEITDTWVSDDATGTWALEWTVLNTMITQSGGNYYRKANQLFTVTPDSYQLRYNPQMQEDWAKNNDPSYAGGTRYWVRYRIDSTITGNAPIFEQWKLHSNRTEVNADGYWENMGNARAYVGMSVNWNLFKDSATTVADQDLYLTTNCNTGLTNNVFNSDGDSVGTVFSIPPWVDTSAPLRVSCVLMSSTTGTLTMKAWLNHSVDGDTISITDPTSTTGETSNTVSKSVTAGEQITFNFELDISDVGAESDGSNPDLMWLNMEAESRPGNINGLAFNAAFLSWRQGGHV